jgi:hypothetical protein
MISSSQEARSVSSTSHFFNPAKDISWSVCMGFFPDAVSALLKEMLDFRFEDIFKERG